MTINNILTINNTEITEHGRKIADSEQMSSTDVDLASGHRRRFFSKNKKQFSLSWTYLPNLQSKTLDGRVGRDFLFNLANISNVAAITIALNPNDGYIDYVCHVDSYSETLIRRDIPSGCTYYDVSLTLTEK